MSGSNGKENKWTSPLFDADEVGHVRPPHAGPVVVVLSRSSLNFLTLVALLYFSHVPALISAHVLSRYVPSAKRCTHTATSNTHCLQQSGIANYSFSYLGHLGDRYPVSSRFEA